MSDRESDESSGVTVIADDTEVPGGASAQPKRERAPRPPLVSPLQDAAKYNAQQASARPLSLTELLVQRTPIPPRDPRALRVAQWGDQNVALHGLYKKYERKIGQNKLPGIYVICACVENQGAACQNCNGSQDMIVKIGLASDLATRFDSYHGSYPHGFTVLYVFALARADGTLFPEASANPGAAAAGKRLLDKAENMMLNGMRACATPIADTRPGFTEFFRVPRANIDSFNLAMKYFSRWTPDMIDAWRSETSEEPPITASRYLKIELPRTETAILVRYGTKPFSSLAHITSWTHHSDQPTIMRDETEGTKSRGAFGSLVREERKHAARQKLNFTQLDSTGSSDSDVGRQKRDRTSST